LSLLFFSSEKGSVLRTLQSFLLVGVVCAAAAALPGCGSSGSGGPSAAGGAPGAAGAAGAGTAGAAGAAAGAASSIPTFGPGNATNGATLYNDLTVACNSCHGTMGEGGIGPNITFSTTAGIGTWTEAQFYTIVRFAKARSGMTVCTTMAPFPVAKLSDAGINDIWAYLMTTKDDTANRGQGVQLDATCATE
jgi:mono/diheme cytochrome c family protein